MLWRWRAPLRQSTSKLRPRMARRELAEGEFAPDPAIRESHSGPSKRYALRKIGYVVAQPKRPAKPGFDENNKSEQQDLNLRPPVPKTGILPS